MVTVLWLVGIANAFNLIDGMDGFLRRCLFASLVIWFISYADPAVDDCGRSGSLWITGGISSLNFSPASIFLGDSGALFVGFMLASLSVQGTQEAAAVAVVVPFRFRISNGRHHDDHGKKTGDRRPIFEGDNEHIHHMLLARGWSQRKAALVLYGVCASFGLAAVIFPATGSKITGVILFVISVAVIIAVGHLRYHEVDEIRAGVRRTVGDRRLRAAKNIQVRRAARALAKASDLHEVFDAIRHMLEFGEFTFAHAQVGQAGYAEINEKAFAASKHRHPRQELEMRNGRVFWSWIGEGGEPDDRLRARSSWCFRMPLVKDGIDWGWVNFYHNLEGESLLVDTNYLCNLFLREFTEAVAKIMRAHEVPSLARRDIDGSYRRRDRQLMSQSITADFAMRLKEPRASGSLAFLTGAVFLSLLVLLAGSAIPYGTVEPWWKAAFVCGVFSICIVAIVESLLSRESRIGGSRGVLLAMLSMAAFAFVQTVRLRSGNADPAISALNPWNAISGDPYQTRFFAFQPARPNRLPLDVVSLLCNREANQRVDSRSSRSRRG